MVKNLATGGNKEWRKWHLQKQNFMLIKF
jgi:hypothetical protein